MFRWFPNSTFFFVSLCFALAASALRKTAKSALCVSLSASWLANPGQTPTGAPQSLAPVLDSEHGPQFQPGSILYLLVPTQTPQGGAQYQPLGIGQPISTLSQPTDDMVQYQPAGNNLTPLTHAALTDTSSQCQPAGNGSSVSSPTQCLPTEEGHIPTAIVDAQLSHPVSRDNA